jgi:hypothetical protein
MLSPPWRLFNECGLTHIHVIAFITETPALRQVLACLDEPTSPPCIALVRGPPLREIAHAGQGRLDPQVQPALPAPDCEFDQRIVW